MTGGYRVGKNMAETFKNFTVSKNGCRLHGIARTDCSPAGLPALCGELNSSSCRFLKNRKKVTAAAAGGLFVKRYNLPGFFTQLRRRFKTPRPELARRAAVHLAAIGIPTPPVLAAFTEQRGFRIREYLITCLLPPQTRFMNQVCREMPSGEAWSLLCRTLIPMVAGYHDAGFFHGDLNLRNIYLDNDNRPGLMDLDGAKIFPGSVPVDLRAREIARLISSFLICRRDDSICADCVDSALAAYSRFTTRAPLPAAVRSNIRKFLKRYRYLFRQQRSAND